MNTTHTNGEKVNDKILTALNNQTLNGDFYNVIAGYNDNTLNGNLNYTMAARDNNILNGQDCNAMAAIDKNTLNGRDCNTMAAQNQNTITANYANTIACEFNNTINLTGTLNMVMAANGSKFKGKIGNGICMVEFDHRQGKIIGGKFAIIDGETLKQDTYYTYQDGEFIEVI